MSEAPAAVAPTLRRRLACALYEGVVLFGVCLIPAVFSTLFDHLLGPGAASRWAAQLTGFLCFGLYFVWLWTRTGQTLPMQTWRIKLVTVADGRLLRWPQAAWRYTLCWLWVAPAVLVSLWAGWAKWQMVAACGIWMLLYGALALLHRDRQFLHDRLAGTRLVMAAPVAD
ncbi:MAG: RDD family protein [Burkholderiales bacterium]